MCMRCKGQAAGVQLASNGDAVRVQSSMQVAGRQCMHKQDAVSKQGALNGTQRVMQ